MCKNIDQNKGRNKRNRKCLKKERVLVVISTLACGSKTSKKSQTLFRYPSKNLKLHLCASAEKGLAIKKRAFWKISQPLWFPRMTLLGVCFSTHLFASLARCGTLLARCCFLGQGRPNHEGRDAFELWQMTP